MASLLGRSFWEKIFKKLWKRNFPTPNLFDKKMQEITYINAKVSEKWPIIFYTPPPPPLPPPQQSWENKHILATEMLLANTIPPCFSPAQREVKLVYIQNFTLFGQFGGEL